MESIQSQELERSIPSCQAENSSKAQRLGTINSAAFLFLACLQCHALGISKSWAKLYTKTDRPAGESIVCGGEMMCSVQVHPKHTE